MARVAEILDCDENDVRRLIDRGHLQAHGIGKRGLRVYLDSVGRYQSSMNRQPKMPVDKRPKQRSVGNAAHLAAEAELRKSGILP